FGDAAVEERQRCRDAKASERAAAANDEVETIVEAKEPRIGIDIARAVAAAAGAAQIDGAVDVLGREAGVGDRKAGGLRGHHAFRAVLLCSRHPAAADDRISA